MAIWSLATQQQDDGVIDVSLYPTEYRAYEALTNIMFGDDLDEQTRREALLCRLRELPTAADKMEILIDTLSEIGLNVTVSRHQSPAPIAFRLGATMDRKDQSCT
jgi:hypothetical protein